MIGMIEKNISESQNQATEVKSGDKKQKILNIVGIALCAILVPILIINCVLIVKGLTNKDEVPGIFGRTPLIVLTDSMYPEIKSGDIIICKDIDPADVKKGDVISFFDPEGNGTAVVTHRVIDVITNDEGALFFRTQGDNNNAEDKASVPAENLVGIWTETRFAGLGHVALFMQSTWGLIVCIFVPLAAFVAYEVLRRRKQDTKQQSDIDALMAELAALKAAQQPENKDNKEE